MTYVDDSAAAADRRRLLLERAAALEAGDSAAASAAKQQFKERHVDARDPEFKAELAHAAIAAVPEVHVSALRRLLHIGLAYLTVASIAIALTAGVVGVIAAIVVTILFAGAAGVVLVVALPEVKRHLRVPRADHMRIHELQRELGIEPTEMEERGARSHGPHTLSLGDYKDASRCSGSGYHSTPARSVIASGAATVHARNADVVQASGDAIVYAPKARVVHASGDAIVYASRAEVTAARMPPPTISPRYTTHASWTAGPQLGHSTATRWSPRAPRRAVFQARWLRRAQRPT